jgi:hypothetical protein
MSEALARIRASLTRCSVVCFLFSIPYLRFSFLPLFSSPRLL